MVIAITFVSYQGPHFTGKAGKMAKKKCVSENTGNFEILPKHMECFCSSSKFPDFRIFQRQFRI